MSEEPQDDEAQEPQKRKWLVPAALLALVLIAAIFTLGRPGKSVNAAQAQETAAQAYSRILAETRTGIRLARLDDFLTAYPASKHVPAARVQRGALKAREDMAWAKLSDAVYNLDAAPEDKSRALATYVKNWSQLNRQKQLAAISAGLPIITENTLTFPAPKSRFNKGGESRALVGGDRAPAARPPAYRPAIIAQPQKARAPRIIDVRVKTARRPVYPRRAWRRGINAQVTLALDIDENGRVARTRVVSVSAPAYKSKFVKAARRAATRSRFHPKTVDGRAVASSGYLRNYTFRAEE